MKIKPNTYYKLYYNNINSYNVFYTDTKHVYEIAYNYNNNPLIKSNEKRSLGTIKSYQEYILRHNITVEEISKGDVFLELL